MVNTMTCEQDSPGSNEPITVPHNTVVHKTSKTVAQKVSLIKIKDEFDAVGSENCCFLCEITRNDDH